MNTEKIYVFKFKISDSELASILLNHLKHSGQITDSETSMFKGIEKSGSSYMVEFAVKSQE